MTQQQMMMPEIHHKKFNSDLEEELNQRVVLKSQSHATSNFRPSNEAQHEEDYTPSTSGFIPTNRTKPR